MTKEIKYGIIADVHQDPMLVGPAINFLKLKGAQKLIVNGDIGNRQATLKESQDYIAFILDAVGKSGLESFVHPGSHESLLAYGPVIDAFADKYDNLFDTQRISHINQAGHQLVFLPGSDFLCGGEYNFGKKLPSGKYMNIKNELVPFEKLKQYFDALNQGVAMGALQYSNMNDIKKLVTEPDKTIIICHVPRKFNNLENCVDIAEFGEVIEDFELQGKMIGQGSIYPIQIAPSLVLAGYPIKLKKENRGNIDLRDLYEEVGIKKAVSAHFHESGHRANDISGNHVFEDKFVDELFWNSGCLDKGQTGILSVKEDKVSYQNFNLFK